MIMKIAYFMHNQYTDINYMRLLRSEFNQIANIIRYEHVMGLLGPGTQYTFINRSIVNGVLNPFKVDPHLTMNNAFCVTHSTSMMKYYIEKCSERCIENA